MATENLFIFSARPRAILRVPLIPEFLKRIPNTFLVEQLVCPAFNERIIAHFLKLHEDENT